MKKKGGRERNRRRGGGGEEGGSPDILMMSSLALADIPTTSLANFLDFLALSDIVEYRWSVAIKARRAAVDIVKT